MLKVPIEEYQSLLKSFTLKPGSLVAPFLLKSRLGEAYTDDLRNPQTILVKYKDDLVIKGIPHTDLPELLRSFDFTGLLEFDQPFAEMLTELYPQAVEMPRACFYLEKPPNLPALQPAHIRWLTIEDATQLHAIGQKWIWNYSGEPGSLIENFPSAGAFIQGILVSVCSVFTCAGKYQNLSVTTHPDFRGKGIAAQTTAFLCKALNALGNIPVWVAFQDNYPSIKIALKLGFKPYPLEEKMIAVNWHPE